MEQFLDGNIIAIIVAVVALGEAITRLTPTEKDNTIFTWIARILDIFLPNKAKSSEPGSTEVFKAGEGRKRIIKRRNK